MIEELIDIVTKNGELTGEFATKSKIHKKGYYHNTAHIWLYTKSKQILLQQRAKTKAIYPLLWDVSVAGHIDSGENITQGALREIKEEIDLSLTENCLIKIGVFECFKTYANGMIDNEFHHTFIGELNVSIDLLNPQKEEVEALKLVSFDDFEKLLNNSKNNHHFIPSNKAYYLTILSEIKNILK